MGIIISNSSVAYFFLVFSIIKTFLSILYHIYIWQVHYISAVKYECHEYVLNMNVNYPYAK